ncbi:MAG: T9SS type A sorting domain-containing protein, partial [Bacteroidales bacterium]|nr:T9SS type A sorting domain-containing protein [Bacteroidales bacterium]
RLFDDEMDVVILGNFDVETKEINPNFPTTGNWFEFYTSDTLNVTVTNEYISLLPGEYRLYTSVKLEQPDIPASIFNVFSSNKASVNVFPNPSSDTFYFELTHEIKSESQLYVYNNQGQLLEVVTSNSSELLEFNSSELPNGIYFYKLINNNRIYSGKLLKN